MSNYLDPMSYIDSIEIESIYTPRPMFIKVNGPSDPNTSAAIKSLVANAKPQITFHMNSGLPNATIAPYGAPGPTHWDDYVLYAEIAGAGLVGLLGYALVSLILPAKKSSAT